MWRWLRLIERLGGKVFPKSFLFEFNKFCECVFSNNMDTMSVSQFHTHGKRHTFHEIKKNKSLFDWLVTAVSHLRETIPSAHATITWVYHANSASRRIWWDMTRDILSTDACWYKYFITFFTKWKMKPFVVVICTGRPQRVGRKAEKSWEFTV